MTQFDSFVELLLHRAYKHPTRIGYTFLGQEKDQRQTLTYGEIAHEAKAIAAGLQSVIGVGQPILLLYPVGISFITSFFGCLCSGSLAIPAYPPKPGHHLSRIRAIIQNSQVKFALTTAETLSRIKPTFTVAPELANLHWLTPETFTDVTLADWDQPDLNPESLAILQYTSGSTADPKGVMISHGNLLHNSRLIYESFGHSEQSRGVIWLPPYHDMGLIGGILQPLYAGMSVTLLAPVDFLQNPFRWLQAISQTRATTSGGPNFAYDLVVRRANPALLKDLDLSSWTIAFTGSEPIQAETLERFYQTFAPCGFRREAFFACYGLAESTLMISGCSRLSPPTIQRVNAERLTYDQVISQFNGNQGEGRSIVSCGQVCSDLEVKIINHETLTHCPAHQIGEIWIAGPSVAKGYWEQRTLTIETFCAYTKDTLEGPFLRTGDLGYLDNGELYVTGRIKDLIIIRGQNHYPQDIEKTVQDCHPALRKGGGAAFSISLDCQEKLVVLQEIERQHLRRLNTQEAINAIRKAISEQHGLQVHEVVLIRPSSIPKTSSGKIQRHVCRSAWLNKTLLVVARSSNELITFSKNIPSLPWQHPLSLGNPPEDDASSGPIVDIRHVESWLISRLALHLKIKPEDLDLDEPLSIYGLDSACAVRIAGELAERFKIVVEPTLVNDYPTIRAIAKHLVYHLGSAHSTPDTPSATEIDSSVSKIDAWPEYRQLKARLEQLDVAGNPFFKIHNGIAGDLTQVDGKTLINYASYNYLGLSGDPNVSKIAKQAIDDYGTSVSASRVISGEIPLHTELEREIADFIGVEDCITFVGGHATNVTTIGHLLRPKDLIICDALSHNSIQEGCQLSGAAGIQFSHNDCQHLERILQNSRHRFDRVLIVVEGVYSADGDIAPLSRLVELKQQYHCLLMVDEAHSIGILGASGRGISEQFQINPTDVDLWMGTLSKSFASCGGYIAGSAALTTYLKYTAPGFVFSVGLSPANTAASLAAIRLLKVEPQRVEILHKRTQLLRRLLLEQGFNIGLSQDSAIIPVIVGESEKAIQLSQAMFAAGINVAPMIYPSVGQNVARLRFFVTTLHTEAQIQLTVNTLLEQWRKLHDENPLFGSGVKT